MIIGVPQEVKNNEFRVGLTPGNVRGLCKQGHSVLVQRGAGEQIGLSDEAYRIAGATLINSAAEVFKKAEMIVKVKEPQAQECAMLREDQILFTYLHLAPDPVQTRALIESGASCIAYETVTALNGALPLLAPMSEVAGRMSIQAAATHLEKTHGGLGVLMAGVPGVSPARVVILGAGVVGTCALQMAVGMGAKVTVLDKSIDRLRELDALYGNRITTLFASAANIERSVIAADAVIGSVLVPGASAPKLVDRLLVSQMRSGSVIVDVAIDQGGCFETSRPTTHENPTFIHEEVVHYCVANMPGAVARTSTMALTNATSPFVMQLANLGTLEALQNNPYLMDGLNVYQGAITCEAVARAQGRNYTDPTLFIH